MIRFHSIADGNCMYGSFAVAFIAAFRQHRLENHFNHPVISRQIAELVNRIQPNTVVEPFTADAIKDGLNTVIRSMRDGQTNNWVKIQETFAEHLRAMVIDAMERDLVVNDKVQQELCQALRQCVEISTAEAINLSDHFAGMTEIRDKLEQLKKASDLDIEAQAHDLIHWFLLEGWEHYLRGTAGIAKPTVYAGFIEGHVLSHLFAVQIDYYSPNERNVDNRATMTGLLPVANIPMVVLNLELSGIHWNALLNPNQVSRDIVRVYGPQKAAFDRAKDNENWLSEKRHIAATHESFEIHHVTKMPDMPAAKYRKLFNLTEAEYSQTREITAYAAPAPASSSSSSLEPNASEKSVAASVTDYLLDRGYTIFKSMLFSAKAPHPANDKIRPSQLRALALAQTGIDGCADLVVATEDKGQKLK